MWNNKCKRRDIETNDNYIQILQLANDEVLVAQARRDLEHMTKKIHEEYRKCGMKINIIIIPYNYVFNYHIL